MNTQSSTPTIAPFNPANFLILVVDDLVQNLQLLGELLEDEGYNVTFATSGQEGLDRSRTTQPDLILLDLMMPNMNGWEVCEQLKNEPYLAEIPVIFLTASHEKQHLIHAFEQGAVDYITKPFNIYELLARVKTHLQIKHLTDLLKKALERAEKLAMTDSLTEIYNRRYWLTIAQQEFNRTCRYDRSFSVVIFDLDNFKKLNDTYGHLMGENLWIWSKNRN